MWDDVVVHVSEVCESKTNYALMCLLFNIRTFGVVNVMLSDCTLCIDLSMDLFVLCVCKLLIDLRRHCLQVVRLCPLREEEKFVSIHPFSPEIGARN